jgi:pimeloyl-ACP methyl ester carboxylesterase
VRKSVSRGDVRLSYLESGSGEPALLFIHGWCCDATFWRYQLPDFEADHRVVALDLRGHGESDKPDQDYGIQSFVDDVLWLMEQAGVERPVLVGHSMGGVIALSLLRRKPDAARGAVLVDSPVVPLPENLRPVLDTILNGLKSAAYVDAAKSFVTTFMFREDSDTELKQSIIDAMSAAPQRLMWTALGDTMGEKNLASGPLPVPALYLRASIAIARAEEIRERYPALAVEEFDAAHFLHMEKPEEFNSILRRFLESVS